MAGTATQVMATPLVDNDHDSTLIDSTDEFMDSDYDSESLGSFDDISDSMSLDEDDNLEDHQVLFTVKSAKDIVSYQETLIHQTSTILGSSPNEALTLLRGTKWDKDRLFEQVKDITDILPSFNQRKVILAKHLLQNQQPFICDLCCDDDPDLKTVGVVCNHRFCLDCYRAYLSHKINYESETRLIKCPHFECQAIVDDRTLQSLVVEPSTLARYQRLLLDGFVDDHDTLRWCPAPDCQYLVECRVPKTMTAISSSSSSSPPFTFIIPTVQCTCSHSFCFGCGEPDHRPALCKQAIKWTLESSGSHETLNWILTNTKECPKCHAIIQKDGGCDYMTCGKCHHGFCWICFGNHHFVKCNLTPKDISITRTRKQQKKDMEKFLTSAEKFKTFNNTMNEKLYKTLESKLEMPQPMGQTSWLSTDFLPKTVKVLVECRLTLKWSIVFHYYLAESNQAVLFENNLNDLELAAEQLSLLLETPLDNHNNLNQWRLDVMNKASYVQLRRDTLLHDTAKGLLDGTWSIDMTDKW